MNTPHTRMPNELPGLHTRLTVLQADPTERAPLAAYLARLLSGEPGDGGGGPALLGPADYYAAAREAAIRRVEEHERSRGELSTRLRHARERQAVTANRRDEAAARARRLTTHLGDCDNLLERAGELTNSAEEARRALDDRRAEHDSACANLRLVEEQRAAAEQMIEDAAAQLRDLETSELDETTLRREVERANNELRAAAGARAEAGDALRAVEQAAAGRATTRDHLLGVRADMVARVEAPETDTEPVRLALEAFDAETATGEPDMVARELAREWIEVDDELARIEDALPEPPSEAELQMAEQRLEQLEVAVEQLEAAGREQSPPNGRDEIEAAHEAVLAAEEDLDRDPDYDEALDRLARAQQVERATLARHGYESYLDVIMSGPGPDGDVQADLLDALRARRVAEDDYESMRAAAEPPAILTTLRSRRERIYREAAELLGCDPGQNVAELLYAHPVVPPNRTLALASALAAVGIEPVGMSVREAAVSWLVEIDHDLAERDECRREVHRVDAELDILDEEDARAAAEADEIMELVRVADDDLERAEGRLQKLEEELSDRATQDERRLQRIAAAEQLRAQIAAVGEAIERSDDEYHVAVQSTEAAALAAEATLERATAALSDAVRRLRRIAEGLPPALRPRAGDDPLGELPRLRDTLSAEVERAEHALAAATDDLEQARAEIDATQSALDDHLTVVPTDDISDDDLRQAVRDLVGTGSGPAVLDDPLVEVDGLRTDLLDALAATTERRPVVLLTDDATTLGWAISLPSEIGTVTRLCLPTERSDTGDEEPLAVHPGPAN